MKVDSVQQKHCYTHVTEFILSQAVNLNVYKIDSLYSEMILYQSISE